VVRLNRAEWRREGETTALDPTHSGVSRCIDQGGCGGHPAFAVSGVDVWITQLQYQIFHRLCRDALHRLGIVWQALAQSVQDARWGLAQTGGGGLNGYSDRFFLKPEGQG